MGKKEQILEAAQTMFTEHGYDRSTTAQIAARAGVAPGLIFHYYKTKENLLYHVSVGTLGRLVDELRQDAAASGTGLEAMERCLMRHVKFIASSRDTWRALTWNEPDRILPADEYIRNQVQGLFRSLMDIFEGAIARGVGDGSIRPIDPSRYACVTMQLVLGYGRLLLMLQEDALDPGQETVEFCLAGLRPT